MDIFIKICSFIVVFFIGIKLLQTSLLYFVGEKMKHWIRLTTDNILKALFVGTVATILLQSSSLVLVLTISLVTIGAIPFRHTIGIILGANVGTTISGELLAIAPKDFYLIFIALGLILLLTNKNKLFFSGTFFVGIGLILVALLGFESLATWVLTYEKYDYIFQAINNQSSLALLTGTGISAIIQSSSASFGIILSLIDQHVLTITAAIAIMLGTNIGTCITSLIAMIGTNKEAHLVAYTHTLFNLFTVLIVFPFLGYLTVLAEHLANDPKLQLAHISVIFNIFSVIIILPFIPVIEKVIKKEVGTKLS